MSGGWGKLMSRKRSSAAASNSAEPELFSMSASMAVPSGITVTATTALRDLPFTGWLGGNRSRVLRRKDNTQALWMRSCALRRKISRAPSPGMGGSSSAARALPTQASRPALSSRAPRTITHLYRQVGEES